MKILHAYCSLPPVKCFHFWIENAEPNLKNKTVTHARFLGNDEFHPFASNAVILPELMVSIFPTIENRAGSSFLNLKLPSQKKAPLFSKVLNKEITSRDLLEIKNWKIPTLNVDSLMAYKYLLNEFKSTEDVRSGSDFLFLKELVSITVITLENGLFKPVLVRDPSSKPVSYQTFWQFEPKHLENCIEKTLPFFPMVFLSDHRLNTSQELWIANFLNDCLNRMIREKTKNEFNFGNIEDQDARSWLTSLVDSYGFFEGDRSLSDLLCKILQETKVKNGQGVASLRLLLKLYEPQNNEDVWRVKFLIQDYYRQNDAVDVQDLWGKVKRNESVSSSYANFEEFLLEELNRLATVYKKLSLCLSQSQPSFVVLTNQEAYQFLREDSLRVKAAGGDVILPEWWMTKKVRASVVLKVKPVEMNSQSCGIETLLDYEWQVDFAGKIYDLKSFEKIVRRQTPLIRLSSGWAELRMREIENAILYFDEKLQEHQKPMSLLKALQLSLQGDLSELGLPVSKIEAAGWIRSFIEFLFSEGNLDLVDIPETFKGVLRPYQHRGVSWFNFLQKKGFGVCLADDMGLGKTIQLIAFILHERRATARVKPQHTDLLICPMSIVSNWEHELCKFGPSLKFWTHHGAKRLTGEELRSEIQDKDLVITTYQLILRDQEFFKNHRWNRIILDEAQNIKNESAQQTLAVKSLKSLYRIALTGTPVENRLSELWSIMDFLNPGYLGTIQMFKKKYQKPIEKGNTPKKLTTLNHLTKPFILRRLKTDRKIIQDLPEKLETKEFCELTQNQRKLYQKTLNEMFDGVARASGIERRGLIFSLLTKLKQICNHPAHFLKEEDVVVEESGKSLRMIALLEDIRECDEKTLIFTQYVEMGKLLEKMVRNQIQCPVFFLHGGLSKHQRIKEIEDFQGVKDKSAVFILSTKAGGVGLNLTAANHVIHYDRWWNPAVENQATDRAFRIGQTKQVLVHKFICSKTFEERIDQMIDQKLILQDEAVVTGENFLTEISNEELREILTLKE